MVKKYYEMVNLTSIFISS